MRKEERDEVLDGLKGEERVKSRMEKKEAMRKRWNATGRNVK